MALASSLTTIAPSDFYNAMQWAIGLELFLLIDDPWRVFFTTDHPNGAPFTTYPEIFALLMDRDAARRVDCQASAGGDGDDDAALDLARIHALRNRHHDTRCAGKAPGACRSRTPGCRGGRGHRSVRERKTTRPPCSATQRWFSRMANWSHAMARSRPDALGGR